MKHIKRFCCKLSIATGARFIGFYNIIDFFLITGFLVAMEIYAYLALLILPILCFKVFMSMLKHDASAIRRRFYILTIIKSIVNTIF